MIFTDETKALMIGKTIKEMEVTGCEAEQILLTFTDETSFTITSHHSRGWGVLHIEPGTGDE